MGNINIVNFENNDFLRYAYDLAQYDYGQILRIQGLKLPPAVEIHFSLQETGGEAKRRIGITRDGVTDVLIPDFILEGNKTTRDYEAYAFIYPSDEESGETTHKIAMKIKSRPEPEGNKGSGETSFGAIMAALNKFAEGKADSLKYEDSILKLMSGEMELARVTITGGSGGGTAREIELQKSETAIQWRYVGDGEWNNLIELSELKPVKGKDYFTDADKKEIADSIPKPFFDATCTINPLTMEIVEISHYSEDMIKAYNEGKLVRIKALFLGTSTKITAELSVIDGDYVYFYPVVRINMGEGLKNYLLRLSVGVDSVNISIHEISETESVYSKEEIDEMFGTYVNEVSELVDEALELVGGGE